MRSKTKLKIGAGLIVATVGVMATVFLTTDVNTYKAEIAAAIEAETGREIVFGGDIALSLGRTTTLTVNDVQLSNVPGGSGPDMLHVAEATAEVALLPLWRGEIDVQRLVLRGTDILVDIDQDGRTNFEFLPDSSEGQATDSDGGAEGADFLLRHVGDVDIRDAQVTIHDVRNGQTQQLMLQRMRLSGDSTDPHMHVEATGAIDIGSGALPFDLEGEVGRLSALISQEEPYPLDLRGTLDGISLSAAGTIVDPFAATGLALEIDVLADDLSHFGRVIGEDLPPIGPARLIASLSGAPDNFSLIDLQLEAEDSQLAGTITFDLTGERLNLTGDLSAIWLDLTPWLASGDRKSDDDNRLFSSDPIQFAALRTFDGRISVSAETLVVPDLMFRDAALTFDLKDGKLNTSPARARFDGRAFSMGLGVDTHATPPAVSLSLKSQNIDIGRLLARIFDNQFIHGAGGIDLSVEGQGNSIAEIFGSSAGYARVLMDAGEIKTGSLGLLVGGVSELLPGLGNGNAEWTAINCVAGDFDVRGGVATSRVALLDADILRLVGEGQINLSDETIEFQVVPSAKKPTLNLSVPVNLRGSLVDPSITPDELSLLRRLGGLVGAVIFPPAALLSLGSLGSHDNPCLAEVDATELSVPRKALDRTGAAEADAPPEPGGSGSKRLMDAVKRLLPLRGDET